MADGYGLTGTGHLRARLPFICDLHPGTRDGPAGRPLDPSARDLHGLGAAAPPHPHMRPAATQPS